MIAPSRPPSPSVTPVTSARGFITVVRPLPNSRVTSPLVISGEASVFEAALSWRITDGAGRIIAHGDTTASVGAPGRGTFSVTATFTQSTADAPGAVEVFEVSPRDGTVDEIARVPVILAAR